jgi:hypothetical protein
VNLEFLFNLGAPPGQLAHCIRLDDKEHALAVAARMCSSTSPGPSSAFERVDDRDHIDAALEAGPPDRDDLTESFSRMRRRHPPT